MSLISSRTAEPQTKEYCAIVSESVEQLDRANVDLIAFVHGKPPALELLPIDTRELVSAYIGKVTETYRHAGITVSSGDIPSCTIKAHRERLLKSFSYICTNAREAMPDGGTMKFSVEISGGFFCLSISDSGCGMPVFVCERAAEPMFSWGKGEAPGLGLAQASMIAAAHKGVLEIGSLYKNGTKVTIRIPISC